MATTDTPRPKTKKRRDDATAPHSPAAPDPGHADTLTNDEEEAYSLLVEFANARKAESGETRKSAPKTRVEFSRLVTRARAVRFVLSWFAGALPSVAMQETGIGWGDLMICRLASPDFNAVFDFCRTSTGERLAVKALNMTEKALDGWDVSKGAASLSKFILERLAADSYGDPRYKSSRAGSVGGGGNTYNINLIQAAGHVAVCGASVAQQPPKVINGEKVLIDAEIIK